MKASTIIQIDALVRSKFTYKYDDVDQWRSFAEQVKAGLKWSGDCDDLAMTNIQLMAEKGAPDYKMCRMLVSSTGDKRIDHMIAAACDDEGNVWIVGDTFGPAYRITRMRHRPLMSSLVADGIRWQETPNISSVIHLLGGNLNR